MEGERQDIFDGKFGEQKEEPGQKGDLSFSEGAGNIAKGFGHLLSGLKHIFFKSFSLNLLLLLLLVGGVIAGTLYLKPTVTGAVVYQNVTQDCPTCEVCPEQLIEEKISIKFKCSNGDLVDHEVDCPKVEPKTVYMYRCTDGRIVEDESECKAAVPEIDSEFNSKADGITLSIDAVEFKNYAVNKINYTIINEGDHDIKPKLLIKIYDSWTTASGESPDKTIRFTEEIETDSWIIRSDSLSIDFDDEEDRLRLELQDASKTPPEVITAVAMDFR
ncbi:MAG: hypothetical protein QF915_03030 [Candidatus Woesearchaeota archaeon]|jgi:hypothetical protein|nr:hypothetical protein [Candidatus Woesearchaeota archaeon]